MVEGKGKFSAKHGPAPMRRYSIKMLEAPHHPLCLVSGHAYRLNERIY